MSAPGAAVLRVVRGDPTPEELAGLLAVFAALRAVGEAQPDAAPPAGRRGWGRPGGWQRLEPAVAPDAAGWQRSGARTDERTG
ncbi:acyl-CoA carboxylase subunit epsilon [Streptomyces sp. NPDC052687]|uniref:acyl-CoA carboxylase subunit epsilon n=1 Tax=Streptomyces sp. NPDC052687 TaxID=3154759 RepID=UPI0034171473